MCHPRRCDFPGFIQLWLLFFMLRNSAIAVAFAVVMSVGMDSFLAFWNETLFQGKLLIVKGPHIQKETGSTFSHRPEALTDYMSFPSVLSSCCKWMSHGQHFHTHT
ncbi:PREDICTED: GDNF antisense RNA 1 (head to head) [Rhinopithecus bieti]|uniref:GDNF antisense RNA 1 (head to head) n=1 Tax=Rhinopithecus bieti TaxID=61621 RepID=UPI00083C3A23|nr:PREDICTED: GDNF antisense RNA 1 (head to head) [Rhinopithecus bieti]XP_017708710.1 PREDICTED: GDNF antisense RNA 1 (head to head) [Rhinopithecus bieti]XP_017708711.1 PREDICTED: GDNF antisense RNA 1 (head to head) [Rhinopithecus bieti]XP_017708712.1 PREDICTED: GDNF antisense RNA 1 (head to head) [Rhinopithecus bieti]XP_017708713.1 PREDICTED: GDNF antisense RNA 1 (head to head) [Rhinopithecus bieti]XP_017708714.1 PREDICTED: GDNF antisense RNA 1 (head to head) [Rhinopithecus bieti]XP_01770871